MQRVYRLAVFAQLEVQLHALAVAVAHGGNALAAPHGLAFAHEQALVVAVGGEVGLVVLHDDEVAVAAQAGTAVHHFAVGSGHNGLAGGAADVDALFTAAEAGEDVAGGGALPGDAGGAAGAAGYGRRGGGVCAVAGGV